MPAQHVIGLSKLWSASDDKVHPAGDCVPVKHARYVGGERVGAPPREAKVLISVYQSDLIAPAQRIVVSRLCGHLPAVDQAQIIVGKVH